MIIDGHVYCFPPHNTLAGHASMEEKLSLFQRQLGVHHQPVWRVRDRAPDDDRSLVDPQTSKLRSVAWKYEKYRLTWEYGGESYTKQYFPPMLRDQECPPELLIAEMDYAGVDVAIVHTWPPFGRLNRYLADAAASYPSRIRWLVSMGDSETLRNLDAAIQEIQTWANARGCCGLQFFPRQYSRGGRREPWDDGAMRPFWEAVAALGLPVYFTLSGARSLASDAGHESYLDEHRTLLRWMERYPHVAVVITHGLPWRRFLQGDRISFPEAIWEVFEAPQCHLQLMFPIQLGGMWEYPWKEAEPTVKECVERIGADRLIWGTDMPMVARFCTYRQAMDQFRVHCDFLGPGERQAILGGTAARVMALGSG